MSAAKKTAKKSAEGQKSGTIKVDFNSPPGEFLHFNRYLVESFGDFLKIYFWFVDDRPPSTPVFRGIIWKTDLAEQIPGLKKYIEQIGLSKEAATPPRDQAPLWISPPASFNLINCISRGSYSEIVIRNISHKTVMEASESNKNLTGTTHGAYISDGSTHRMFVRELIQKFKSQQ